MNEKKNFGQKFFLVKNKNCVKNDSMWKNEKNKFGQKMTKKIHEWKKFGQKYFFVKNKN